MHTDDDNGWKAPPFSRQALQVYGCLDSRGGTVRMRPLMDSTGYDPATLIAAVNELHERCWVRIVWRKRPEHTDADVSRPLDDAERIVATRFGKFRYPQTVPPWQ